MACLKYLFVLTRDVQLKKYLNFNVYNYSFIYQRPIKNLYCIICNESTIYSITCWCEWLYMYILLDICQKAINAAKTFRPSFNAFE